MTPQKKATRRRRRPATPSRSRPPKASPTVPEESQVPDALVVTEPERAVTEAAAEPEPLDLPLSAPEPLFAARVAPPEPERPQPAGRRAIFFDVENTSRAQHIAHVIDHLRIDRHGHRTEFVAVGNWRVIGHDTARLLAAHGAHLIHSAPSVGVRDWSDLRIAVTAGAWLAGARPGDVIEIVSDDRAFDAVGDVAASLGITFRRLSYRALVGAPAPEMPQPVAEHRGGAPAAESRGRRGGRSRWRDRRGGAPRAPHAAPMAPRPERPQPAAPTDGGHPGSEPHTAPHDEIIGVVRDLMEASPAGVSIDALANTLKARGFSRPPGSPRLITRLRRIKEIDVSRSGMITLVGARTGDNGAEPVAVVPADELEIAPVREPEPVDLEVDDEGPGPGNERVPSPRPLAESAPGRRRRRRGGRHRRGHGGRQPSTTG